MVKEREKKRELKIPDEAAAGHHTLKKQCDSLHNGKHKILNKGDLGNTLVNISKPFQEIFLQKNEKVTN